ncbi:ribbon-helix-helix protein, CopG family [Paraclostridium sordellii]|uniref:ribbon-helix-helix protein, CopG family n=1 Tax=Paraclostridium sordellii TaxID=1505 RepID=UPI000C777FAE|nr:ribbon-helix-helix protein, CopG family [Paeniclostridium sordellii]AUN14321.1 hypothetical protein RSJ16_08850 [Paeniclostridium sordellii]
MNDEKKHPISIRLKPKIAEEFRKLAQNNGVSQSGFIEILIENFNKSKYEKEENGDTIKILLSKYNNFFKDENKKRIESMKYEFKGYCVYGYDFSRHQTYSANEYEYEIKDEFEIDKEVNLEDYELQNALYAYWNKDINKYIILEILGIKKKLMQVYDVYLNRCYEVENCKELGAKLHKYSNQQDRLSIEMILADPIKDTKDFELFY